MEDKEKKEKRRINMGFILITDYENEENP